VGLAFVHCIAGSNPARGLYVCWFFYVVLSCVGTGLATDWPIVQEVLRCKTDRKSQPVWSAWDGFWHPPPPHRWCFRGDLRPAMDGQWLLEK
jgi:hypothetical protein